MNPFVFGKVVTGKEYCPREEMERKLAEFAQQGQNVCLLGPRRIGKTSLIVNVAESNFPKNNLIVDFWGIKKPEEATEVLLSSWLEAEKRRNRTRMAIEFLRSLSIEISVLGTGVKLSRKEQLADFAFDSFFQHLDSTSKKSKKLIALDEFQSLMELEKMDRFEMLGRLRKSIQHLQHISFIYAGSVRHQMTDIFQDPESPFYQAANILELGPIQPETAFREFLGSHFRDGQREATTSFWKAAESLTSRNPSDLQRLCSAVWDTTSPHTVLTDQNLEPAIQRVFQHENDYYLRTIRACTAIQKKCLIGIAKLGGESPTSSDFLQFVDSQNGSTVLKALSSFQRDMILWKNEEGFQFVNPFFREWLKRQY